MSIIQLGLLRSLARNVSVSAVGFALLGGAAVLADVACSPDTIPSSSGGGGAGGSGGAGGAGGCVNGNTTCPVVFTYPLNNEHTVVLRGNFAPDGWTKGVAMTLDDEQWTASIDAKNGQSIQYKFFVDGMTWENDPNNMNTVSDGNGGVNNVIVAMCPGKACAHD